jgi:hypothetical protein|tara:strand:- start:4906 stop:5325 length:420 start_codon:yes stop_codon:yes gene_type:complete
MKKLLILFLLFIVSCTGKNYVSIDNGKENIKVDVEVADDLSERTQGLMFRESLNKNSGMLFIFEEEEKHAFWMKNTLIPLDMIFISEDLEIVDIKNAIPCEEENCKSYAPKEKAKYVLEVNGDFTTENNINIGDRIRLS